MCPRVWRERGGHLRRPGPPRKVREFWHLLVTEFIWLVGSTTSYCCFPWSWRALVFSLFRYCVCFDPLDGSSNIDCGVSIGTVCVIIITFRFLSPPEICTGKWVKRDQKTKGCTHRSEFQWYDHVYLSEETILIICKYKIDLSGSFNTPIVNLERCRLVQLVLTKWSYLRNISLFKTYCRYIHAILVLLCRSLGFTWSKIRTTWPWRMYCSLEQTCLLLAIACMGVPAR